MSTKALLEFVKLDARNAILFTEANTRYIKEQLRLATKDSTLKPKIYAEIAKKFALDHCKVTGALVMYVNKLKTWERKKEKPEFETDITKLCRKVGHRYIEIRYSHLRAYKECVRCGKIATKYKLSAR